MSRFGVRAAALAAAMLAAQTAWGQETAPGAGACDRECLIGVADRYMAAIVAHDPSAAPLAGDVRIVENAMRIAPGEGLWETAMQAPDGFVIHVPDEEAQSVGYMAAMTYRAGPPTPPGHPIDDRAAWRAAQPQTEQPVLLAIRLQLNEAGEIAEAEHMLAVLGDLPDTLSAPRTGLLAEIPEGQRLPRGELKRIGATYYDALQDDDGALSPFAADCARHENGMVTAGGSYAGAAPSGPHVARDCADQLSSGQFQYIQLIEHRRMFAADPVTGLAIGFSHFRHPMDNLPYPVTNTDGSTRMQDFDLDPFDALGAHIYKIGPEGEIHEIEAIGIAIPYQSPTGWE